jgi:DNA polymerase
MRSVHKYFDRTVLRHCGVNIPVDKITDTMVLALQHSLPHSPACSADVLGVPQDKAKDKAGEADTAASPSPGRRTSSCWATRETHPPNGPPSNTPASMDAMRDVYRRLPRWNNSDRERQLWLADQR